MTTMSQDGDQKKDGCEKKEEDQKNIDQYQKGFWKSILNFIGLTDITEFYKNKRIGKELPDILAYLKLWHRIALFLRLAHISIFF